MSWQASRWARDQRAGSATAKAVLLILAEAADGEGYCYLSHQQIADRAEVTRRAVIAQMKVLEEANLIDRARRHGPRGHRSTDSMRLLIPSLGLSEPDALREGDVQSAPRSPRKGSSKVNLTTVQSEPRSPHKIVTEEKEKRERASPSPRKASVPIPDGFPDDAAIDREREFLKSKGCNLDARLEAEGFRSWALANGRTYRDWPAAFHNWVIKSIGWAPASAKVAPIAPGAAPPMSSADIWRPRLKAFADPANRYWNTTDWGPGPGKPGCRAPAELVAELGLNVINLPMSTAIRIGVAS